MFAVPSALAHRGAPGVQRAEDLGLTRRASGRLSPKTGSASKWEMESPQWQRFPVGVLFNRNREALQTNMHRGWLGIHFPVGHLPTSLFVWRVRQNHVNPKMGCFSPGSRVTVTEQLECTIENYSRVSEHIPMISIQMMCAKESKSR